MVLSILAMGQPYVSTVYTVDVRTKTLYMCLFVAFQTRQEALETSRQKRHTKD